MKSQLFFSKEYYINILNVNFYFLCMVNLNQKHL